MAELEKEKEIEGQEEELDLIDDINAWKKSHVPKDEYERLKAENKKLMKNLMNGDNIEPGKAPEKPNIEELKKKLMKPASNMERWQASIDLHEATLELTGQNDYDMLGENAEDAEMVYEGIKYCLEVADGRPEVFNATLDRIMSDMVGPKPRR